MKAEQSNTSIVFGDWFVLKLLRRAEEGVNLDLEIGRFLTERSAFVHSPPVAGALEYRRTRSRSPWGSSTALCPTRAMPGNTPWTSWQLL